MISIDHERKRVKVDGAMEKRVTAMNMRLLEAILECNKRGKLASTKYLAMKVWGYKPENIPANISNNIGVAINTLRHLDVPVRNVRGSGYYVEGELNYGTD